MALDVDRSYVRRLDHRYGPPENFSVIEGNLEDPDLFSKLEEEELDTVLCVNVLEHLDRPDIAVRGFHRILPPGGKALILVPAHGSLYSAMDKAIEHRQRYEGPESSVRSWKMRGSRWNGSWPVQSPRRRRLVRQSMDRQDVRQPVAGVRLPTHDAAGTCARTCPGSYLG